MVMQDQAWNGFAAGEWQRSIDVRSFIQKNWTPYLGDDAFLTGPTRRTKAVWKRCEELLLQELKKCGESLVNIADELAEIFSGTEEKAAEAPAEPAKEYTFTEVRAFLAEKSRAGHTAEIRKILEAHGADKLSALDKGEYAAVMAEAEVLG